MSDYDGRPFGHSNRGSNPSAGPDPSGYPSWYDNERHEEEMPKAEQARWLDERNPEGAERFRRNRTNHRAICVDGEGSLDCVCGLGNPTGPPPTEENR